VDVGEGTQIFARKKLGSAIEKIKQQRLYRARRVRTFSLLLGEAFQGEDGARGKSVEIDGRVPGAWPLGFDGGESKNSLKEKGERDQ